MFYLSLLETIGPEDGQRLGGGRICVAPHSMMPGTIPRCWPTALPGMDTAGVIDEVGTKRRLHVIRRRIHLEGDLTTEQRDRLAEIARKCPVHKTLAAPPEVLDERF